jgi:hypothetical protein
MATPKNHVVKLVVTIDRQIDPNPNPCTLPITVGDTITFFSDQGAVKVEFKSPNRFSEPTFESLEAGAVDKQITVTDEGFFMARCSVVLASGERIGWVENGFTGEVVRGG